MTTSPELTPIRRGKLAAEELVQPSLHRQRGVERTLGVVLLRRRRPEDGHHRVAGELLDRAARELDLLLHRCVEALQPRTHALRVLTVGERGRAREVGEENRRDLALVA